MHGDLWIATEVSIIAACVVVVSFLLGLRR